MIRKKKILTAVILSAAAGCLLFFGIRTAHRKQYTPIDLPIVLSNEEAVVKTIRDGMTERKPQIRITFTAKGDYGDQMTALADGLVEKALEPTGNPKQGDYIRFQYGGYQVRYSNPKNADGSYDYTIKIRPYYYTNEEKEASVDEAVKKILSGFNFTRTTGDYEKIRTIHDYLADHCEYDWRNHQLLHRHAKSTAYGALISGEASCQGYSVAMYRLLTEAGVGCRVITGYATSPETGEREYHAWNLVCLDGTWYNADVSWDDETGSLDYFLKSDASFATHERDEKYDESGFREKYPVSTEDWTINE